MSKQDESGTIDLPRRTVLGALGAVGIGSAAGGLGTSAFFSDEETFRENTLTAGQLDLKVDWSEHYSDWSPDEGESITFSMDGPTADEPFGFPSAAPMDEKSIYVSDKDVFLENTSVEAYPDTDDDGVQDFPTGWDNPESDNYICNIGADSEEDFDPTGVVFPDTTGYRSANEDTLVFDSAGDPVDYKPLISLDDVKPGDFGEVTFSIHLCDNPGYVWLTGGLVSASENGVTEPEADDPDEDQDQDGNLKDPDPNAPGETVELLDEIRAAVWYDTGSDGVYGGSDSEEGDNYHQTGEAFLPLTGSLRSVLNELGAGRVPLDFTPVGGDGTTQNGSITTVGTGSHDHKYCNGDTVGDYTFQANGDISCLELGEALGLELVGAKVEEEGLQETTYTAGNGGSITVKELKDTSGNGEIDTVVVSTDFAIKAFGIKAQTDCFYVWDEPAALEMAEFSTEDLKEISHIEICYESGGGAGGQETPGRDCFPNSTTAYIGFEWWLPVDHANEIQTDTVSFDLGFYTEQCRHNDGSGQTPEEQTTFTVRVENVGKAQVNELDIPLSPGAFAVHDSPGPIFTVGAPASAGLEDVAEDGDPTVLVQELASQSGLTDSGRFDTPVGAGSPGPIGPGDAYEFDVTATPGDALSFATMFIQSNDLVFAPGPGGIDLFDSNGNPMSGDVTGQVDLWDAGTEEDQEPGVGGDQAPRQSGPNTGAADSNSSTVQLVSDVNSEGYSYPADEDVIEVTITPL